MYQVWGCLDLNIVKFQNHVHQLFFQDDSSGKKALEYGLYCFDNYLFIIKPRDLATEDVDYDFESLLTACPFNFHIAIFLVVII